MKTLNQIIKEATREINELPRRSKAFVDKHVVQKMDYPVDVEDQFTAKKLKKDKTKLASFHDGEDASVYEEVDLEEGVSNLSDARLKFHVLKDVPHGSYTKKEMAAEHLRRKKAGGPAYNAVKPSLNEEVDLEEANAENKSKKNNYLGKLGAAVNNKTRGSKKLYSGSTGAIKLGRKLTKEESELDESKTDVYHNLMLKALGKSRLPKDHPYTSSIANNGDFVVRKGSEIAGRIPKGEHNLKEASMSPTDMKQREDIVKGMKKNTQDFKDRYGSKWKSVMYATATKAAMKEESEQIDESVSFKKTESGDHHIHYNGKPVGRITKTTSMGSSGYSVRFGGNTSKHEVSDESSLKAAKDSAKWHLTSSESPIKMKEESEQINEISRDLARRYIRKVADKNNTGQASPKEVMKRSPGVALAGKKAYGIGGKARVNATESVDLDEVSKKTLGSYRTKAALSDKDRSKGRNLSSAKMYPDQYKKSPLKAKVVATESVDLDEAFKAGLMKLNDGSSVTLTSESSNSLNNLFDQLSSSNKAKMEQRLMSGSKGFNEILAFAKEV